MESNNKVKDYFEQTEKYLFKEFGVRLRQELIFAETGNLADKNILDIGCGNGDISLQYIKANHVTFLDFSDGMLELVSSKIPKDYLSNSEVYNQDYTKLSTDKKYDIILFIGVMAHSPISLKENLMHLKSLLKPGGRLFFQFSDAGSWITKLEYMLRKGIYEVTRITKSEFSSVVRETGMMINKEIHYACILPGMGRLPNRFLYNYVRFLTSNSFFTIMRSEYIFVLC